VAQPRKKKEEKKWEKIKVNVEKNLKNLFTQTTICATEKNLWVVIHFEEEGGRRWRMWGGDAPGELQARM